jgi:FtsH-binding integral membrane protein
VFCDQVVYVLLLGFLRKVYGILSVQLFVTTLVASLFMLNKTTQEFVQEK